MKKMFVTEIKSDPKERGIRRGAQRSSSMLWGSYSAGLIFFRKIIRIAWRCEKRSTNFSSDRCYRSNFFISDRLAMWLGANGLNANKQFVHRLQNTQYSQIKRISQVKNPNGEKRSKLAFFHFIFDVMFFLISMSVNIRSINKFRGYFFFFDSSRTLTNILTILFFTAVTFEALRIKMKVLEFLAFELKIDPSEQFEWNSPIV